MVVVTTVSIVVVVAGNRVPVGASGSELEQPAAITTADRRAAKKRFTGIYRRLRLLDWYQISVPMNTAIATPARITVTDTPGAWLM